MKPCVILEHDIIESKVCKDCNIEKPLSEFHKNKASLDGLNWCCKTCASKRNAKCREKQRNIVKSFDPNDEKSCSDCKITKKVTEFAKVRSNKDGLHGICKSCTSKRGQIRRREIAATLKTINNDDTKICCTCGIEKPKSEFNKVRTNIDGLQSYCKCCNKNRAKETQHKNKQKLRDYTGTKICGSCRVEKPKNKFNKNACTTDGLDHYCGDCKRKDRTQRKIDNPFKQRFQLWKTEAKKKQVLWDLTFDDLFCNPPTQCPVLGTELDYVGVGKAKGSSASLDRIDPTKGYTKGNVQIVSWRANCLKRDASIDELIKLAEFYKQFKN